MPMIQCPECGHELSERDTEGQRDHMQLEHPEVIEERLTKAGFVKGPDGKWEDTLASAD
jgi:hypothetical protein